MADVAFGFVYDFGPGRGVDGAPRRGRVPRRRAADRAAGERRGGDGRLELLGIESADPRWVREAADELADARTGCGRWDDRGHAVPGRRGAARRDGDAAALARGRRRRGAADRARGGRARRLHRPATTPLGAPLDLAPRSPRRRRPHASAALARAGARSRRPCLDRPARSDRRACHPGRRDRLAPREHRRRGRRRPHARARGRRLRAGRAARPRRARGWSPRYTGLRRPRRAAARPRRSTARLWIADQPALDALGARPGRRPRRARAGPARRAAARAAGALLAVEVGALSGFLGQRVLGQYEFPLLDPTAPARLLFVGPNLAAGGASRSTPTRRAAALGRAARDHARAAVRRRAVAARAPAGAGARAARRRSTSTSTRSCCGCPRATTCAALVDGVREGELISWSSGRSAAPLLDELQATMALIEGYAEHVMDAVGERCCPPCRELRAAWSAAAATPGLLRLLRAADRARPQAAPVRAGQALLRRASSSAAASRRSTAPGTGPEPLPTLAELEDPDGWLARTAPRLTRRVPPQRL